MYHPIAARNTVAPLNQSPSVAKVKTNAVSAKAVITAVASAGLCGLRIEGISAIKKRSCPIPRTQSCQGMCASVSSICIDIKV